MSHILESIQNYGQYKKKIITCFHECWRSLYEPLGEQHWRNNDNCIGSDGVNRERLGVWEYNELTDEFDIWSAINFYDTNYSIHIKIFDYLIEHDNFIDKPININEHWKIIEFINRFCAAVERNKELFFTDGEFKRMLDNIHLEKWEKSKIASKVLKTDLNEIWPTAIKLIDIGDEKGNSLDFEGIDSYIEFENGVKETIQNKICWRVLLYDGYHVYCTMNYEMYRRIKYFCFYPNDGEFYYVFKNDPELIDRQYVNNKSKLIFHESLLIYKGKK